MTAKTGKLNSSLHEYKTAYKIRAVCNAAGMTELEM